MAMAPVPHTESPTPESPTTAGRRLGPGAWRDVLPDTVEYRLSMLRAIQIYGQVRGEGRAGPSPTER